MIAALPPKMYKYLKNVNNQVVLAKEAPEDIKEEARQINKISLKFEGKPFFVFET